MISSLNRPRWITAATMAAVAVPALAACHGMGSVQSASPTTGATTPPAAQSPAASSPAAAPTTAGGLTPPGTHLALGQAATLGWVPAELDLKPGAHTGLMIKVTVKSIEKGSIADFANVQLDASQKKDTPYYVRQGALHRARLRGPAQ